MDLPSKIQFRSDDTIIELQRSYKDKNGCFGVYKYLTGYYFKGKEITLESTYVNMMVRKNIAIVID